MSSKNISRREVVCVGASGLFGLALAGAPGLAEAVSENRQRSGVDLTESIANVLESLDEEKLVRLALELTDIPNALGEEEPLGRFLYDKMKEEGLRTRLQSFAPKRCNVLGTHRGTGGGRSLMLIGHLESGPKTDDEFPKARIEDGEWIRGKGIWNMKGAIAAYVAAVGAVRKAGIQLAGDVLIAGVAGAHDQTIVDSRIKGDGIQGYSIGTVQLLAQGVTADVSIVGEPTSFKLVKQHFGVAAIRVDIKVKRLPRGVVADLTSGIRRPDTDAVKLTAEVIQAVRKWIPEYKRRNKLEGVEPWVNITAIEGGGPWSPYPAMAASLYIFAGMPPGERAATVLNEIESVLDAAQRDDPELESDAQIYFSEPGPFVADDNPIVTGMIAAHTDIFGGSPTSAVVPWHSDASPLVRAGIAAVNYGPPGEISPSSGEGVRIKDLVDCARVYADLIVRVCGNRIG